VKQFIPGPAPGGHLRAGGGSAAEMPPV